MSEAEAPTKPVEAVQPEAVPVEEKPVEEKSVEQPEEKSVEQPEEKAEDNAEVKIEEKTEDKPDDKAADKTDSAEKPDEKSQPKLLKTTAKIDYENHRNNRKFDPTSRDVTDDPVAIRKQVEFYFGDWNLPQDKFMWESSGGSENKPMKIKTIHSFKRMRTFQPYSAVLAALKDSTFLEVSGEEGEEEIKRKVPYKPAPAGKAKADAATVYVKGFGDETPNTQFDLETFFAQFGEVKGLKLRRTNENLFKGSVFVTFIDEETSVKFLTLDPAPKWKDHELKIMTKKAYCEEKSDLIRQGKLEPNSSNPKKFYEGKDGNSRGRGRGGNRGARDGDSDDWKKRRDHDQKNGFRGGRGGRGGRGRGRGGRGRGGRDGGRDRDGPRDRNAERKENETKHTSNDTMPRIQSTADTESKNNGKRSREEDHSTGEPAAKKVDVKQE